MPISLRKGCQHLLVKLDDSRRIDGINPVLLVNRLAVQHLPPAFVARHKVVKAASTDHVAEHRTIGALHHAALRDGHLGLRDRAVARYLNSRAAQKVEDAHTFCPPFLRHANKVRERALEPGRHHHAFGVPDGCKALPVTGIAPDRPALYQLPDQQFVFHIAIATIIH